jgi:hypothetical protein
MVPRRRQGRGGRRFSGVAGVTRVASISLRCSFRLSRARQCSLRLSRSCALARLRMVEWGRETLSGLGCDFALAAGCVGRAAADRATRVAPGHQSSPELVRYADAHGTHHG